jgi:hypothetical protein
VAPSQSGSSWFVSSSLKAGAPIPFWVVLTTAVLAVVLPWLTAPTYLFSADGAHYVALARSLSEDGSYVFNGRHEVMYPPAFPLLLMPVAWAFDGDFTAIVRWAASLSALVFPLTFVFARDQGLRHPGYVATLTLAASTFLNLATGNPVSDLVYMACSLALLIWWHRAYATDAPPVRGPSLALGSFLLLLAVSTRSIGIAALVAATAALIHREWSVQRGVNRGTLRAFLPVIPAWLFFIGWTTWTITMHEPWYATENMNSYLHQIVLRDPHVPDLGRASILELAMRPLNMAVAHGAGAAAMLTPLPWVKPNWFSPVILGLFTLVLAGCWRTWRVNPPIVFLYFAAYSGVLVLWPFTELGRFLVPIVPILWVLVARGVTTIHEAFEKRPMLVRALVAAVALIAMSGAALKVFGPDQSKSRQDLAALIVWAATMALVIVFNMIPWTGLFDAIRRHGPRLLAGATVAMVAVGLWRNLPPVLRRKDGAHDYATAAALSRAADWLTANTPGDATLQATFADGLHFATGRRTVGFPVTMDAVLLADVVEKHNPQFLVVLDPTEFDYFDPPDDRRFRALMETGRVRSEVAYTFPGGRVMRLFPTRSP